MSYFWLKSVASRDKAVHSSIGYYSQSSHPGIYFRSHLPSDSVLNHLFLFFSFLFFPLRSPSQCQGQSWRGYPSRNHGDIRTWAAWLLCLAYFLGISRVGEGLPKRSACGCSNCRRLKILVPEMNSLPPHQQVPAVTTQARLRHSDDECIENYTAFNFLNEKHH